MAGRLQAEIRQAKPFRSLEAEAYLNLHRTFTVLLAELVELLRPLEITQPQYNVLRILRGAGDAGLPSGEVGDRMVSRDPDMTRLLDRLEARGLVSRQRDATDRRVITIRITEEGRRLTDGLDAPMEELHKRQLGHLSKTELRTLISLLDLTQRGRPSRE